MATSKPIIYFNYQDFFNYYSNQNNFYLNNIPIAINFYKYENNKYVKTTDKISGQYFTFANNIIYVVLLDNDQILFTILRPDNNNAYWADHFHIGNMISDNITNKIKNVDTVFLHFSYQDTIRNMKDMTRKCNFKNNYEDIDNIKNILCTNRKSTMVTVFGNMIDIVEHILKRYVYGPHIGGKKLKKI